MTEQQIKEKLSHHFVELIASRQGFKCGKPEPDHGVDLQITRTVAIDRDGKTRYLDTGEYVQLQMKCTTLNSITEGDTSFKYDLEVKTYNDLVDRLASGSITPLYLVLLVLPPEKDSWLSVTADELVVRRNAYWYRPPVSAERSANDTTTRIEIPYANRLTLTFFDDRFAEVYS